MSGVDTTPILRILGGGAAQGVVDRLRPEFEARTGVSLQGRFGAVGAMREALLAGEPADVLILSTDLIRQLQVDGWLVPGSDRSLGWVETGVAVLKGVAPPAVDSSACWREALVGCTGLYVPDMTRSTAGRHVAAMLAELRLREALSGRLHEFANGQTAMAALAAADDAGALGCTQVTEIVNTRGVTLVGALPAGHELATEYRAAVTTSTALAALAAGFVDRLGGPDSAALRSARGFLPRSSEASPPLTRPSRGKDS